MCKRRKENKEIKRKVNAKDVRNILSIQNKERKKQFLLS